MKGKIRIILDELRDIERTEGLGAITEGKINEICKAQGVSFDEFKSSVLKILAEEAGISLDELNSFLLEEIGELEKISELDLDKISGGASVPDTVKRGAASLMAILNLSGMSNSYAGMPDSAKVRRDHGAVISKSKVVLSKEEIAEKWVKRLGASAAGAALTLLAVIGLNKLKNKENNASGDNDAGDSSEASAVLSGGKSQRLAHGREAKLGEQPKWDILFKKDDTRSIAAKLGSSDGPTKYFVHLSNYDQPDKFYLRIVGSADSGKTVLISDACWCLDENEQIANNTADAYKIKKWEDTKVFVYDDINDLNKDGIISRLKKFYHKEMENFRAAPTKSAEPEVYVPTIPGVPNDACDDRDKLPECTDELQQMFDWEKSDAEQQQNDKTSDAIKTLKKSKMALYVYGEDIPHETAQRVTSERAKQSIALKLESNYIETQLGREQYKFASDIDHDSKTIIKRVLGISEIPDLRLAIVGTASTDYHHLYKNPMIREKGKGEGMEEVKESGPSGRPSARYAKMFKNSSGEYCAIDTTTDEQELARSAMLINNTLRAMDGQWIKDGDLLNGRLYLSPENIDYKKIKDIADKIGQMQAYHGCSSETFEKILDSGRLLCVDRVKDPLINKTDKQKVQAVWYSLSNSSKKRPDASFEKLIKSYDTDTSVREFLKSCVGHVAKNLNRIAKWEKNITDQLNDGDAVAVKKYVEDSNTNSSLKDVKKAGLNGTLDIGMGTFQTIFSIVGGNCNAFEEYTYTSDNPKFRCIIEIPQRCLSYTFPYAVVLDDASFAHGLEDYATNGDAEDPKPSGVIIDKALLKRGYGNFPTGVSNINVTTGSLLFGDNPAYRKKGEYSAELGQAIKGKKLNIRKECARKALAFYIYCQYIVITKNEKDPGGEDVTADDILEAYYQKLGSHACMEGHSPGEIPLGESGAQRVLFVGIKTKDMEKVVKKACDQGLKVNCIDHIPQTRAELIAEFERCK